MEKRNSFIYQKCEELGLRPPDIEPQLNVHYGQCAEDLIVMSLLRAWSARTGTDLSQERYLEIGANHAVSTSATYLLHSALGMTGVLVEANRHLLDDLAKARPHDTLLNLAIVDNDKETVEMFISNQSELSSLSRRFVEEWRGGVVGLAEVQDVPAMRINTLLAEHFPQKPPLYLSVDIEGLDYEILNDMDRQKWRPLIVQAEPSDHFKHDNSTAIRTLMEQSGYLLIARTDVNLIFTDTQQLHAPNG